MKLGYPFTFFAVLILLFLGTLSASAQSSPVGTGFTYQGSLVDGDKPATGNYDFRFTLFDHFEQGNVVTAPLEKDNLAVLGGVFTTLLDFGAVFSGQQYFLEIEVRAHGESEYTVLAPRHSLTAVPYALYALNSPAGPQGEQGPQGPAGEDGLDGQDGVTGPQGPQGERGLQGPQGIAGATGITGPVGAMGPTGPAGVAGPVGATGPQGLAGASVVSTGPDGATGARSTRSRR